MHARDSRARTEGLLALWEGGEQVAQLWLKALITELIRFIEYQQAHAAGNHRLAKQQPNDAPGRATRQMTRARQSYIGTRRGAANECVAAKSTDM